MLKIDSLSRAELARAFGCDVRSISRWKKAGLPCDSSGGYSLPDCIRWRLDQAEVEVKPSGDNTESDKWLGRFRKERALTARIERKKLQGELITLSDCVDQWCRRIAAVKQSLFALDIRLPAICEGKSSREMRPLVRAEAIRILEGYSRPGQYCETPAGFVDQAKAEGDHQ